MLNDPQTNSEFPNQYIQNTRKFHRKWALFLYLAFISLFYVYAFLLSKNNFFTTSRFPVSSIYLLILNVLVPCVFSVGVWIFEEYFVKMTCFCFPLIMIYFLRLGIVNIFIHTICLAFWVYFMIFYYNKAYSITQMILFSLRNLLNNLYDFILLVICGFSIQFVLNFIFLTEYLSSRSSMIGIVHVILVCWTVSIIIYSIKIYISGILVYNLIDKISLIKIKKKVAMNIIYLLGSAATIFSLKSSFKKTSLYSNLPALFLNHLLSFASYIYEIVINIEPSLAITGMSIHGHCYQPSLMRSYRIFNNNEKLRSLYSATNSFLSLIGLMYMIFVNNLFFSNTDREISNIVVAFMISVFFSFYMLVISSLYVSGIYLYLDNPVLLRVGDREFHDFVRDVDKGDT